MNALTNCPLVVQRQVKALRRSGPSSPPDADQNVLVIINMMISMMGGWMVLFFIVQGILSPLKEPEPETILQCHLFMLPMIVPLSFLIATVSVVSTVTFHMSSVAT